MKRFFIANGSPLKEAAEDFLTASDRHGLDWRLLPSISLVETGAGRVARHHNIFGWDCGRKRFSSVREAIHTVARVLATSATYRRKSLVGLLEAYNPNHNYPSRVMAIMRSLGPEVVEQAMVN